MRCSRDIATYKTGKRFSDLFSQFEALNRIKRQTCFRLLPKDFMDLNNKINDKTKGQLTIQDMRYKGLKFERFEQ